MSVFGKDEVAIKKFAASVAVPEFNGCSFITPKPLHTLKVALVTTAGLYQDGGGFEIGDSDFHFETLPKHARDLKLGHHSVNFDRGGFAADINVVFPIDRLQSMAESGVIGAVANNHYAFAGNQSATVSEIRLDSGPRCAQEMLKENVDVVILTSTCPLCPRTVCTLAHVFEAAGLATLVITPLRAVAERMGVPRTLHTEFPLGLSLGKPRDEKFQTDVLMAAFDLLNEPQGPVIKTFPVSVSATDGAPLVCGIPPRINTDLHPAVDEAQALKAAYDRAYKKNQKTSIGMRISAEEVPDALAKFVEITDGKHWEDFGFVAESIYGTVHDIRTYYEELACELAEGPITPWSTEQWFYDQTEAGKLILSARRIMRDKEVAQSVWFGLAPAGRP